VGPSGILLRGQRLDWEYGPTYVEVWNEAGTRVTLESFFDVKPWAFMATLPAADLEPGTPGTLWSGPRGTLYWRVTGSCPGTEGGVVACSSGVREFEYVLPEAESPACVAARQSVRLLVSRIARERHRWRQAHGRAKVAARMRWFHSRSDLYRQRRYISGNCP
jgi:hypothetical protein